MAKLLVVEEHEHNRRALTRLLSLQGHEVTSIANGAEAILLVLQSPPDLILMAQSLPVISGTMATGRLRAHQRLATIPIILIGPDDPHERQLALYAGCDDYVTRPVIPAKLVAAVEQQLCALRSNDREGSVEHHYRTQMSMP